MIVCPNCNHENPQGAALCETCYTPLSGTSQCPNCGATVQTNATFCGQCGLNLDPDNHEVETPKNQELKIQEEPTFSLSEMEPVNKPLPEPEKEPALVTNPEIAATQLQIPRATLLHVQTNEKIELPQNLEVIHLGKPNAEIPPDIDVSGFPGSQFVSRIHADIRVEGDAFYLEDTGSCNGTYINYILLPTGSRHRLSSGDRIALGKEDKVSFIFHFSTE